MKIIKSKSGREVRLESKQIPHDFGYKFQKEFLTQHHFDEKETIFSVFARIIFVSSIVFVIFGIFRYYM